MPTTTRTIAIPQQLDPVTVLGPVDEVLREVERAFPDLTIIVRGNRIAIMSHSSKSESQAAQAEQVVADIIQAAYTAPMDADTVRRMLDQNVLKNPVRATHPGHGRVVEELRMAGRQQSHASHREETADRRRPHVPGVITFALGKPVRAKTAGQIAYVNAIESHTITFAIGPAGTGKSLLAIVFLAAAIARGEKTAFFVFDEEIGLLFDRMKGLGIDLEAMQRSSMFIEQVDAALAEAVAMHAEV